MAERVARSTFAGLSAATGDAESLSDRLLANSNDDAASGSPANDAEFNLLSDLPAMEALPKPEKLFGHSSAKT